MIARLALLIYFAVGVLGRETEEHNSSAVQALTVEKGAKSWTDETKAAGIKAQRCSVGYYCSNDMYCCSATTCCPHHKYCCGGGTLCCAHSGSEKLTSIFGLTAFTMLIQYGRM